MSTVVSPSPVQRPNPAPNGDRYGLTHTHARQAHLTPQDSADVTALGLGVLLAYRRFLRHADELMRKIQLDALALTVGIVSGFSYALLESAGIVADAEWW